MDPRLAPLWEGSRQAGILLKGQGGKRGVGVGAPRRPGRGGLPSGDSKVTQTILPERQWRVRDTHTLHFAKWGGGWLGIPPRLKLTIVVDKRVSTVAKGERVKAHRGGPEGGQCLPSGTGVGEGGVVPPLQSEGSGVPPASFCSFSSKQPPQKKRVGGGSVGQSPFWVGGGSGGVPLSSFGAFLGSHEQFPDNALPSQHQRGGHRRYKRPWARFTNSGAKCARTAPITCPRGVWGGFSPA